MEPTAQEVAGAVVNEAGDELEAAVSKIDHCLKQLSDEQVWWRPPASMNSVANLILHLCGNVRQWITSGIGGAEDMRDRPKEFSEQVRIAKDELLRRLDQTVSEARRALANLSAADLLRRRRIQGFEVTGFQALVESVAHFRGHTQEIVHITRCQLGDNYDFAFVPTTPEQGAPQE